MSVIRHTFLNLPAVHNNYYFLRQLSKALEQNLVPSVISECFSQNKDELIIRFETTGKPFIIRATLNTEISCLSFPSGFSRARKNSIDLFEKIIGHHVLSVVQFRNERSFALTLTKNLSLVFKMHGGRANVLLFEQQNVVDIFRKNLDADKSITLDALHREIDFSFQVFKNNIDDLKKLYYTFGPTVWSYLKTNDFSGKSDDGQWAAIQQVLKLLDDPTYYITEDGAIKLSLLKVGDVLKELDEPIAAVNAFFAEHQTTKGINQTVAAKLAKMRATVKSGESYLRKTESRLFEVEQNNHFKTWADLIMANMHLINAGADNVTLEDFESRRPVQIKLKPELSPQKNAELFYKKAKNQHIEIKHLQDSISKKKKEMESLKGIIKVFESTTNPEMLPVTPGLDAEERVKEKSLLPYNEIEYKGFRIWIGKNAEANDRLTQKFTYKEDLWLHAKDVAGSHVVIKYQANKPFPKDVIETAASLAAYNSKRKNESLCPVIVTPKKYVRKRKGDPAGAVVVDREEVILVPPVNVKG